MQDAVYTAQWQAEETDNPNPEESIIDEPSTDDLDDEDIDDAEQEEKLPITGQDLGLLLMALAALATSSDAYLV